MIMMKVIDIISIIIEWSQNVNKIEIWLLWLVDSTTEVTHAIRTFLRSIDMLLECNEEQQWNCISHWAA